MEDLNKVKVIIIHILAIMLILIMAIEINYKNNAIKWQEERIEQLKNEIYEIRLTYDI